MKILDTNLWVFGTLGTNNRAERLLDDIERGKTVSAINAYMVQVAFEHRDREPTIFTNDADFAAFTPAEHDLSELAIEYVD